MLWASQEVIAIRYGDFWWHLVSRRILLEQTNERLGTSHVTYEFHQRSIVGDSHDMHDVVLDASKLVSDLYQKVRDEKE